MNRPAQTTPAGIPMPRIGALLGDGLFAGIAIAEGEETNDAALVDLGYSPNRMTHAQALNWAAERGGHLASRAEGRVLANLDSISTTKPTGWFWLETQFAGYESFAWMQDFLDGLQLDVHKSYVYPARAVRRLPLQPFDHSVIPGGA